MATISAQVSLYPLRRRFIGPAIRAAVRTLQEHDLRVRVGEMSTLIWGEEDEVFAALQEAFRGAVEEGDAVMEAIGMPTSSPLR